MNFKQQYDAALASLTANPPAEFEVRLSAPFNESGNHPADFMDVECAFASKMVKICKPLRILDIGSYRHFTLGLAAGFEVVSVDVRQKAKLPWENRVVADVRKLNDSVGGGWDAITSLCTMEHIGLGRYGDEIDLDGDRKAFEEIKLILAPRGVFIFTVPICKKPSLIFNAHRIYSHEMIWRLCSGLTRTREEIYDFSTGRELLPSEITDTAGNFDIYCGCWRKA